MELHADARLPFPREIVFVAYRDELPKLLPYLPNVRSIEVTSRKDDGAVVELVNEWLGGGDIPPFARAVLSESMLSWTDHATWNADTWRCDWRTVTHAMSGAVRCSGYNLLRDDGPGKTLLEMRGTFEVDAKKLRGVPGFLSGKVARTVEEYFVGKIEANLVETANGLTKYLAEKK